jgi:RNA polymerase sigma factor (sigma-70 family)
MAVTKREAGAGRAARETGGARPHVPAGAGRRGRREEPARRAATIPPFQAFLDEHRASVYRFLVGAVGPDEADDCFQETFLAALRAYPKLRHGDNLRGWILAIATRKAIDAGRARSRRPDPVPDVDLLTEQLGLHAELDEGALGSDMDDPIWGEVQALPPMQRVALVHRVLLDRPYTELAAAMGCSVDSARANVYQGLKRLRERWKSDERD